QPDERSIGEQLQPELDHSLLPGPADLGEARRLSRRPCEAFVSATARAAFCDDDARAGMREIRDDPLFLVEHLRPHRDAQHRVVAVRAVRERAASGTAAAGAELLVWLQTGEVATPRVCLEHDVAARSTVAAVRPALRDVLLAPEMDRPVAAATGDHCQSGTVMEHRYTVIGLGPRPTCAGAARPGLRRGATRSSTPERAK